MIVAKVEEGRKACVAKIRPFETITHVNGAPVTDVAAFEKLIEDQQELRWSVRRMTRGRIVVIHLRESD
ncbi:MAG: hypothetical protein BroJett003_12330 [Planctomycetota bacterium]|nr:MAG: hypothetical protein BroJett003_12330 [Planctomycetota bacterium]